MNQGLKLLQDISSSSGLFPDSYWIDAVTGVIGFPSAEKLASMSAVTVIAPWRSDGFMSRQRVTI